MASPTTPKPNSPHPDFEALSTRPSTLHPSDHTRLSPSTLTTITSDIAAGVPPSTAAMLAGISPHTYRTWINAGEQQARELARQGIDPTTLDLSPDAATPVSPYLSLYIQVTAALARHEALTALAWTDQLTNGTTSRRKTVTRNAEGEVTSTTETTVADPPDWRSVRDYLARRFPDTWQDKSRQDLTVQHTPATPLATQQLLDQLPEPVLHLLSLVLSGRTLPPHLSQALDPYLDDLRQLSEHTSPDRAAIDVTPRPPCTPCTPRRTPTRAATFLDPSTYTDMPDTNDSPTSPTSSTTPTTNDTRPAG